MRQVPLKAAPKAGMLGVVRAQNTSIVIPFFILKIFKARNIEYSNKHYQIGLSSVR